MLRIGGTILGMATYLVTGATGLIGRHLVQRLLADPGLERIWLVVRASSQQRLAAMVRTQEAVPWRVYRPAVVVGHSVTGEMDKVDGPYYFFPALARLAALPSVPVLAPDIGDTNIVPVDYVAEALARLVNSPGLDFG